MANFRFEIGQKVVAYGFMRHTHMNGRVFTVVDRCLTDVRVLRTGRTVRGVRYYYLDPKPSEIVEGAAENQLAPYDPPGSWEDCAWQPKEIKA